MNNITKMTRLLVLTIANTVYFLHMKLRHSFTTELQIPWKRSPGPRVRHFVKDSH